MKTHLVWVALVLGTVAMVGDFVVPSILARKYPGYSPLRDTISTLGTRESPVKKQTTLWLIVLGVCFLAFAAGQASQFYAFTWRHWFYLAGIFAFGLGAGIVAGLFPEDAVGMAETLSGKIHGIGSGLGSILLLLTPLWARGIGEFARVKPWNTLGFATALVAFVLFLISGKTYGPLIRLTGIWQRLYLAAAYGALLVNAFVTRVFSPSG
jgi:hypothetical protein